MGVDALGRLRSDQFEQQSQPKKAPFYGPIFRGKPRRGGQRKPQHKTLTDFEAAMGEDKPALAMTFLTQPRPKLD